MPIEFEERRGEAVTEFNAVELSLLKPLDPAEIVEVIEWCEDSFGPMLIPTGRGPTTTASHWQYTLDRSEKLVLQKGQLRMPLGTKPRYSFTVRVHKTDLAASFRERWLLG